LVDAGAGVYLILLDLIGALGLYGARAGVYLVLRDLLDRRLLNPLILTAGAPVDEAGAIPRQVPAATRRGYLVLLDLIGALGL
jgi:hypothetical protein